MIVSKRKLGIDSHELVEIIDLRETPEVIENLIDYQHYYPGWHMNKKHWYTINVVNLMILQWREYLIKFKILSFSFCAKKVQKDTYHF